MRLGLVTVFLALLAAACGGGGGLTAAPDISPSEVLTRATAALTEAKSFHFRLEHENGSTEIPLNLLLTSAEGDVVVPDRLSADIEARSGRTSVRVKVIGIGNTTWITNPFTRQWQRLPGNVSIRDVADPSNIVSSVVTALKSTEIAGRESVDGAAAFKVTGKVDSSALVAAFGGADEGLTLDVEVWVGAADFLPRKVRLKGAVTRDEAADIVRIVTLSKFNQTIEIKPPE